MQEAGRLSEVTFRQEPKLSDADGIRTITASSGYFNKEEIDVAVELVEERLSKGPESGYEFLFADVDGKLVGYTCFGRIPCTQSSYDLYWIAVDESFRNRGLGRKLIARTEVIAREMGCKRLYVETSSRPIYDSTNAFYRNTDYVVDARHEHFYAENDAKIVYVKVL